MILNKVKGKTNKYLREVCNWRRKRLLRKISKGGVNPSLFCNNCTGAMVLHDFGKPFLSPTVNMFIYPTEYVELLSNLDLYLKEDIVDITHENPYPIGLLAGRIHLYFMHYRTFDEAVDCWKRRSSRVDKEKIYAVLVERDGCSYEDLKKFDQLPYEHKVALTHKCYPDIKCCAVIEGYADKSEVGLITDYSGWNGKRFYDKFDWKKFLFG